MYKFTCRIMRKQLEDDEESVNEPTSPSVSNPSQTIEREFERKKVSMVSPSLKKETVSILKKPGGTSRVGLKKSVTFQKRSPTGKRFILFEKEKEMVTK